MAYINREQTEKAIRKYADQKHSNGEQIEYVNGILKSISVINEQPTADVEEVKHGEWVTIYSENGYHKECSVCGSRWMLDSKEHLCKETKRCYECGAKMDGGKAE